MINRTKYSLFIFIALCGILWAACKQQRQPCLTPKTVNLSVETMHLPTDTSTVFFDTILPTALFTAFTKNGFQPFISRQQQFQFSLTLSPDTEFCQWAFTIDTLGTIVDTLSFYYQRDRQFLSNACGYTYFYTLDSITSKGH